MDGSNIEMYVRGCMKKVKNVIESGWYQVKTEAMEDFSERGEITGKVDKQGYLRISTWRDGVIKTVLKGIMRRNETVLTGSNGDNIPGTYSFLSFKKLSFFQRFI